MVVDGLPVLATDPAHCSSVQKLTHPVGGRPPPALIDGLQGDPSHAVANPSPQRGGRRLAGQQLGRLVKRQVFVVASFHDAHTIPAVGLCINQYTLRATQNIAINALRVLQLLHEWADTVINTVTLTVTDDSR